MNVCVLDMQPISPPVGGGRLRLLGLYHALGANLPATYVGTYDWPSEPARDQQLTPGLREITIPLSPEHFAADAQLRVEAGGKNVIDTAFHQLAHLSPAYLERTRQAVREADIVICSHPWVYPLVKDVVDRSRSTLVYDSHNCEGLLRISLLDDGGRGTEIAKEVISIERAFCQDADLILACSQEDILLYRDLYGVPCEKIRLVPNGVFTDALHPPDAEQRANCRTHLKITHRHAAIFIGSGYQFNTEAAQFIVEQLAPRLPDVLFVVAGGVGQTLTESYLAAHTRENLRVTGFLSDEDRRSYLTACDIGLNPMFGGSGTNIKMFDYMAAGLPAVTTEIGARGIETLAQQAFFVAAPEDFARYVDLLAQHPAIWRQLSSSSRQLVTELYSWERISASLGTLLRTIHARRGTTKPIFSVIIITSDHQRLAAKLRGLEQQTLRDFEIVVIDCCEFRWPEAEQAAQAGVVYVQSDIRNRSALKNLGTFFAEGEIITYLPTDLTPPPDWLARAQQYFTHPDVAALKSGFGEDGHLRSDAEFEGFIRREAFTRAGRFDTHLRGAESTRSLETRLRQTGAVLTTRNVPPAKGLAHTPLLNVSEWIGLSDEEFASTACQVIQGLPATDSFVRKIVSSLASGEIQRSEALAGIARLGQAGAGACIRVTPLLPDLFLDETSGVFHLDDLLKSDGDAFIKTAFLSILRRPPDQGGLEYYRYALRSGTLTKTAALKRLLQSEEADRAGARIIGLNVDLPSERPAGSIFHD